MIFGELAEQGLIALGRARITVLDHERLQQLAGWGATKQRSEVPQIEPAGFVGGSL